MTTDDMRARVRDRLLNRPSEDDILTDPDDYYDALTEARDELRRKIVSINEDVLLEEKTITTSDGGETYDLGGDHLGELQVWAPPGPPNGRMILPGFAEHTIAGEVRYWLEGTTLKLTAKKKFTPGLTVLWVPAVKPSLDADNNHELPQYVEQAMMFKAAENLARKPGLMVNATVYRQEFIREWSGDPDDVSDNGLVGILSRQSVYQGSRTAPRGPQPWWRGISN